MSENNPQEKSEQNHQNSSDVTIKPEELEKLFENQEDMAEFFAPKQPEERKPVRNKTVYDELDKVEQSDHEPLLNQDEIDKLLAGMNNGEDK